MNDNNFIEKFQGFRAELAIAETYEEIKNIESRAAAAAEFARKSKIALDEQNQWGRFRVEIEQKKGAWLDDNFPHGNKPGENRREIVTLNHSSLQNHGINYNESSNARLVNREYELANEVMNEIEQKKKEITPHSVSSEIRKRLREEKYKNLPKPEMPKDEYRIIYADPPWAYNDKCNDGAIQSSGADMHYPTMSIKELCEMELPRISDNAVLFMWTTSPLLEDSFKIINAWGFTYKSSFVWDKVKHNMGHYNSVRHEFLLLATKGSCTPDNMKLFDSVQSIERTKHSEKPEKFREIIDTLYTKGKRIELFARKKLSDNWDVYGNEL
jgi:N6-adenosine-specific RNA methylase IME4